MARQKREKRIDETLDLLDMRAFKDAPAHTLSGGETQRIAIAMGVACFPRVLLLDEPFASVDVENQVAIERIITQIHYEKKIFILFTSHNVEQASRLSRQVISLSRGKPVAGWIHNFYYGRMIDTDRGRGRCRVHETLDLFVDSHRTGNVRLSLDPLQIHWIREAPSGMENEFFMTLVQITDEGRQVRLTGDAGILISLLTPKQEFLTDPPTLGDRIRIRIPKRAVRVF
jgi:tungstate transport system ATP-binding protein